MICGRIEKTPGTGVFHKIMEEVMPGQGDKNVVIAKKLTNILGFNFEQSRKTFIASTEICKKCLRTVCELVKKEEEIKATREDLVSAFFSTTSKFNNKMMKQGLTEENGLDYQHHQKSSPSIPTIPIAFINQTKPSYHQPATNVQVQFFKPSWKPEYHMSEAGTMSAPGSPTPSREYRARSEYGSDIASSSFLSVSPSVDSARENEYRRSYSSGLGVDADSGNGRSSPVGSDFEVTSFGSNYSAFTGGNYVRSKGQTKSYDSYDRRPSYEGQEREAGEREDIRTTEIEREKMTKLMKSEEEMGQGDKDTGTDYSNNQSPRSQESSNSFASDSLSSTTGPQTRPPTPEEEKAKSEEEEAEAELRKPWKKRKRAIESDQESIGSAEVKVQKVEKEEEASSSSSPSTEAGSCGPQEQLDPSTSDLN